MSHFETKMSTAEIVVRMEHEASADRRGALDDAGARIKQNKESTAQLRGEIKKLKADADQLAAQARTAAGEVPHTFFGKLFGGKSKAREAERKSHEAEMKSLEVEKTKVDLEEGHRAQKEALEKMQAAIDHHNLAMSDLTRMLHERPTRGDEEA
jgi:hypothetical protein